MPGETTSEMTEQVSTVVEDSPRQSKPDLPDNELPDKNPIESTSSSSTSSSSTNELTNGLKRPLPDEVDTEKKKKFRLADTSEDEFEVNDNDDSGKNHIELLIQKVSESLENAKGDKESNVSNKTHHNLNNETNSSFNKINHNGNNDIDDKDCKKDYLDKNTLSKDKSKDKENKTSNINNINQSCEFIGNSNDTVKNGKNKLVKNDILTSKDISCSNKSSSSENIVLTENSDHENKNVAVVDDIQVSENISTAVNDSTAKESNLNLSNTKVSNIENIVNSEKNDVEPLLESKNSDETETIESPPCKSNTNTSKEVNVCSNGIDNDLEVVDSDSSSNISLSDLTDFPEDIRSIVSGIKQVTKESFPHLLKLFSNKELTYDQFDSYTTQKMVEMITEKLYWGKGRSELQLLKEREKHWRIKYSLLNRQFKEMKTVVNVHKQELTNNEHARPHLVTRTVGLQAILRPKKEGSMKLPKLDIPLPKPDNNPGSIIVDDDDEDIVEVHKKEFAGSSTSKIINTTTKKQIPPLVTTSKSPVVSPNNVTKSPKTVTVAKSLNPINFGTTTATIDLTGNDDVIEESNIINLEDTVSPVKIIRRNPAAPILPKLIQNGNMSNTFTYVELPNNPSSSSSFIMRTASGSPQRTVVSNKDTIKTSPKPKNLKPILIEVSRVDPVLVQPCTVTYTAQRVPLSQISGTLQPMSTASYTPRQITVSQLSASLKTLNPSYTTCQLPVSRISGTMPGIALPRATPGTTYTACRLPISLRTIPQTGSQSTRKPPPPAIPFLEHPSPVPGIPNQKSLPTWKRLPPAPNLTITKSIETPNSPQALVLSWTMNINKTIAEVISYQIYAYQETPDQPPNIDLWKKIGVVNALPLPMACSLTHFSNGQKYHFLVRAVDVYTRVGPFSSPESIT